MLYNCKDAMSEEFFYAIWTIYDVIEPRWWHVICNATCTCEYFSTCLKDLSLSWPGMKHRPFYFFQHLNKILNYMIKRPSGSFANVFNDIVQPFYKNCSTFKIWHLFAFKQFDFFCYRKFAHFFFNWEMFIPPNTKHF